MIWLCPLSSLSRRDNRDSYLAEVARRCRKYGTLFIAEVRPVRARTWCGAELTVG
jgi:hypothetical protein